MTALQSIFPHVNHRIDRDDFAGLDRFTLDYVPVSDDISDASIRLWNSVLPLHPRDLMRVAENNFGIDLSIEVELNHSYADLFIKPAGGAFFNGNVTFGPSGIADSSVKTEEHYQGKGLGNAWLKTVIELSHAVGYRSFGFAAGLANGAYSWSRAGAFMDMDPRKERERGHLSRELIARLDSVAYALPPAAHGRARALCRLTSADDLVRLCDIDAAVPRELVDQPEQWRKNMAVFLADRKIDADPLEYTIFKAGQCLSHAFERATAQGKELSLPRFLLSRAMIDLTIDFEDRQQMDFVGKRLGGFDYLHPATPALIPA